MAACCRATATSEDWSCWSRRALRRSEAVHIATQNGAVFLGESDTTGSITAGKAADLVVLAENPAQSIDAVETVEMVFKAGLGYDPVKLTQSVRGLVGLR